MRHAAQPENGVYISMIRRVDFRRVLPVLMTVVHIVLLYFAARQSAGSLPCVGNESAYHSAAQQEGRVVWGPMEPKPPVPAEKIAILLNLPALILGIPLVLVFFQGCNIASLYAAMPFVPLVWYCIGWWLDRFLGRIPRTQEVSRTWREGFAVLFAVLLCLSIASITPMNQRRTLPDAYWVGSVMILWSGLFLVIGIAGLRRHTRS